MKSLSPDYETALAFFKEAKEKGARFGLDDWYQYALALYQSGDSQSADQIMKHFESVPDNASSVWWKYSIASYQKQKDKALEYLQQYADMSNTYVREMLRQSLYKAEKELYKYEAEVANHNAEHFWTLFVLVCITALLMLSMIRSPCSVYFNIMIMKSV